MGEERTLFRVLMNKKTLAIGLIEAQVNVQKGSLCSRFEIRKGMNGWGYRQNQDHGCRRLVLVLFMQYIVVYNSFTDNMCCSNILRVVFLAFLQNFPSLTITVFYFKPIFLIPFFILPFSYLTFFLVWNRLIKVYY